MTRLGRISPALAVILFAVALPAFAANVTVNGTVNFSALDGSADDADHTVNGVFTVSGDLVINGTILCIDDSGRDSACPMSFNVGHDLIVNAGGAVYAENRTGTGSGAPITFNVGHDFVMHGPAGTLAGAIVSTDSTSSSGSNGGNITANVSGAVTIESGATIDSGSSNAAAGAIAITAGGHIDASGNVLAGPSRTILSTRLTDDALSGGTGNQIGGAITLESTSFVQPGLSVGSNANIVSQGQVTAAGPVTLQGCGVVVNGLVASLAHHDATSRVVIRSGKSITVDARDLGVTGATLGRNGKVRGDAPTGTAINHFVDLFAFNDINVLGPDPAGSTLAAISGTPGVHDAKSDGATIRVISLTGGVTGSGNALSDGRTASGDDGGNISISSQGNINFDHAVVTSIGDSNTSNPARGGGTIAIRSYSGNVIWTNGSGDVRPTGSASGLSAAAQGQISVTACGTISLSGSTFPTNGSPVGVFPGQTTSSCTPASPSLPAGEPPLPVCCNVITITNPSVTTTTAGAPFSQTFTQTGAIGTATFSIASGTLPTGLSLASNGTLSGTPTVVGTFAIVVELTDSQGCTGVGSTYTLTVACQTITVNNPAVATTVAASPFSVTFTQSGAIGGATFSTTSVLPSGLTLASNGALSGTPVVVGTFPIVVTATDANGCTGSSTYNLTITCQAITVTNPAVNSGTVNIAFSQTFTQSGSIGTATFTESGALPAGLSLSSAGALSGTPAQTGTFPIVVHATDSNGCSGSGATYTLTIACQVIPVTNPAVTSGTVLTPFSATFTASNTIGTTTFSTASALPAGLSLAANGTLSGTPAQTGTFPVVVTATDANGCTGTGATYNLTIACQVITVTNPANANATAGSSFSATFTASNTIGTTTFSTASALPTGVTLSASGVLSGTPTVVGTFPIVVTATDGNGCTGTGATYNLVVHCQTIAVTNAANASGIAGTPFSATFTASNTIGATTFGTASVLPAGLALSAGGVLSGTPLQVGTFPIVVTATDGNGCSGSGATYTLVIGCQVITVTNPAVTTGTANTPFSQTFTASNTIGTTTFSTASTLPAGLSLSTAGVLSGTPAQTGSFPIVVTATDGNGCSGSGATYTLVIGCQTITVNNPSTSTGTVNTPFTVQFTASNTIGTTTFATSSTLPTGLSLAADGTLSGTPLQPGTFPIVVTATDANGCSGTSAAYTLVIACQAIAVTNPTDTSGTVASPFSETFTQSGAFGTATFSTASTLPAGLTLNASTGVLSGTPTQSGTFPIIVTVTDSNGCSGSGPAYTLVIACNAITITNPGASTFIAGQGFSVAFTQSGGNGTVTWSESGALPSGVTLNASTGVLSGAGSQTGSFPIVVTATDANGCTGTSSYTLTIACQSITITNPAATSGTAGTPFSATFTASGILGTATWSETGALPSGIVLSPAGVLSGTTSQTGSFPITVRVTDTNGCFATSNYTLTIVCQTITVTNPATTSGTAGLAFSQTFTATGILGTPSWSESGALPSGLTFNNATGVLSGTPAQTGTFPIVVSVTDSNGCSGSGAIYNLVVVCPTIAVTRVGGGTFPAATFGVGYPAGNQFQATGGSGTIHWSFAPGGQPPGINLNILSGTLSGIPTATGTFTMTVVATDQSTGCSGTASFTFTIKPAATNDSYANLVNNTQAYVTGGTTATPTTPAIPLSGKVTANDAPSGGVTITSTGTFATSGGGSVTLAADGSFLYTPPLASISSDSFTYTISSDTGATGTPTSATATVTLNLANRVWYLNPNAGINGNGQSQAPWNNTTSIAGTASGDIIFIYDNGGSTANTSKGISLLSNQTLWGQGVSLIVNGFTLVSATNPPTLTATSPSSDVVAVSNADLIQGVTLANGAHAMIAGSPAGLSVSNSALRPTGTANGFTLTNPSGSVTLTSVVMNGSASGDMINVSGGTAAWSVTGSTIQETTGRAINVSGTTGGSMSFDSASTISVTSGTSDGAMKFSSNAATFNFGGTVSLTVSGSTRGLVASSSGGTVNITGSGSTISASGGAAIDFQNSTIGASGLNFQSVSANGGINGIVLNNTGSLGGLTVSGNGGTCINTGSVCSGGTIQSSTGHGISLTSTTSPSFNFMKITSIVNSGINGTGVTNFTLTNSVIDGVNNGHTSTDGNVTFNLNAGGATENNLSGVVVITNNHLNNSFQDGIKILNYAGTISTLTIDGNSLTSSTSATSSLGSAILVTANRGGSAAQIGGGSISGNTITNFPSGGGIILIGGNTLAGPAVNVATLASPLLIQDNAISGAAAAAQMGTNGIQVTIANQSTGYFTIGASGHPNTISNVKGNGIACSLFGASTEKCTIAFNTIVANNTVNSPGINTGADQALSSSETGTLYLDIHDNNVSRTTGNGILSTVRNVSSSGIFHIQNNTVARPVTSSGTIQGIRVDAGNGTGSASVCLKISGNTTTGSTNGTTTAPGIGLRVQHTGTTSTMQIDGLTPTPATDGGPMETYVGNTGQNPGSANGSFGINGVNSISSGATYTASTCTIP